MKRIEGFENYSIIEDGRVYSHYKERVISNRVDKWGYYVVNLRKDGRSYAKFVHRLVAMAYIPIIADKSQVNHIDCNKQNNNASNLEWVNQTENNIHCISSGRRPKSYLPRCK